MLDLGSAGYRNKRSILSNDGAFKPSLAVTPEECATIERQHSASHHPAETDGAHDPMSLVFSRKSTSYYIQAAYGDVGAVLRTNLPRTDSVKITPTGTAWLIGRSRNCAVVIPDPAVSRCHALIGHDAQDGFYLMDVGSSNGTFVNQRRLVVQQRYSLQDGDVMMLSHVAIAIFLAKPSA
jgi:hypothetical protein